MLSDKLNIRYKNTELEIIIEYFEKSIRNTVEFCIKENCEKLNDSYESINGQKYNLSVDLNAFKQKIIENVIKEIKIYELRTHLQDDSPEIKQAKKTYRLSLAAIIISALSLLVSTIIQFVYNIITK